MARSTAQPPSLGFRSTLSNRHFQRLWLAQIISQTIQNAANYGSLILVHEQSNSVTGVGGVIIAFSLPAVIFSVPAGVLVDRFDKRTLLWVSNALRGLATFGFVLSLLISPTAYVPIYLLTFFISIVGQFFGPAEGAAIPLLVAEGELVSALSLFNITFSLSQALGLVILGPLVVNLAPHIFGTFSMQLPFHHAPIMLNAEQTGILDLFFAIAVLYFICAALTWSIPAKALANKVNASASFVGRRLASVWHGVVEAGTFVRRDRKLVIAVLQLTLGGTVLNIIAMIAPNFARQFMNQPDSLAAVVFVPAGLGLVIGSILMPRIIDRIGLRISEALGIIGVAACTFLLTFSHWSAIQLDPVGWYHSLPYIFAVVLLTFCIGLSLDLVNLPAQTAMQQQSPDWIKGRVLAFQMMLLNAASIPIILLVGRAADVLNLPVAMNLMGIGVVALGLTSVYFADKVKLGVPEVARRMLGLSQSVQANHDEAGFKGSQSNPLYLAERPAPPAQPTRRPSERRQPQTR